MVGPRQPGGRDPTRHDRATARRHRDAADIAARVEAAALCSPVITVVGEVVALRAQLAWFENRPLFGKRVLVTRRREQASELSRLLRRPAPSRSNAL